MTCKTRTSVWINDNGWTTCATHALLPSLVTRFRAAEERGDCIIFDFDGSWMRAFADDADAVGFSCFYCKH